MRPSTQIPFIPPPPPLRLSQPKPLITEFGTKCASLEQNLLVAKNAAAMMKLQATLNHNSNDNSAVSFFYNFNPHIILN